MRRALPNYIPFAVILVLWQAAAQFGWLDVAFFSSPLRVLQSAAYWYSSGKIVPQISRTLMEIAAGGSLAYLVGIPLGILMGWYRGFSEMSTPVLLFLDAVPMVALGPVIPLILGLGAGTSIALVFLLTMLPLAINVAAGARTVSTDLIRMGRHFGGSDVALLATIVLPSTMPYVIGATRSNIGRALAGALVGEWLGSNVGLGSMMFNAAGVFELKSVYVGALTVVAISLVASSTVGLLERRLGTWRMP